MTLPFVYESKKHTAERFIRLEGIMRKSLLAMLITEASGGRLVASADLSCRQLTG
jgi:hypothetical protein